MANQSLFAQISVISSLLNPQMIVNKVESVSFETSEGIATKTVAQFRDQDDYEWQIHLFEDGEFEIKGFHPLDGWKEYKKCSVEHILLK